MKKLFIALAVCALALPATSAYAEQRQRTDTPKKVTVEVDFSKGLLEVTVYADK